MKEKCITVAPTTWYIVKVRKQWLTEVKSGANSADCDLIVEPVCGLHVKRLILGKKGQHDIPNPEACVDAPGFVSNRS